MCSSLDYKRAPVHQRVFVLPFSVWVYEAPPRPKHPDYMGLGFRVSGSRFRVWGLGSRDKWYIRPPPPNNKMKRGLI